jgi:hypothetical protein
LEHLTSQLHRSTVIPLHTFSPRTPNKPKLTGHPCRRTDAEGLAASSPAT